MNVILLFGWVGDDHKHAWSWTHTKQLKSDEEWYRWMKLTAGWITVVFDIHPYRTVAALQHQQHQLLHRSHSFPAHSCSAQQAPHTQSTVHDRNNTLIRSVPCSPQRPPKAPARNSSDEGMVHLSTLEDLKIIRQPDRRRVYIFKSISLVQGLARHHITEHLLITF